MENLFFYCTSWTWCYQIFFLKNSIRLLLTDQDFIYLVKNCSIEKNQYNVFICNSKSNTKTFLFHFYILSNKYVAHFLSNTKFFHELLRKMCINDNGIDIFDKKKDTRTGPLYANRDLVLTAAARRTTMKWRNTYTWPCLESMITCPTTRAPSAPCFKVSISCSKGIYLHLQILVCFLTWTYIE